MKVQGFEPSEFFQLSEFTHRDLFADANPCWRVIDSSLADYLQERVRQHVSGDVHPGAYLMSDDIEIGEGTVVEPGAYIMGPTIIGRGCEIRHGAYIRGNALIGDGCVVGHATEVKGSVFLDGAKAGHFAYVGDSILGNRVNLGAGTKLANFTLSGSDVVIRIDGARVESGLRKLGAILGDDCQLGCNVVTSPGTLMGKGSHVYPCVSVRGRFHPAGTHLK